MRTRRFLTGLVSGYAMVVVNVVYTVASIPLALHYLSKQEFGIWALVTQITGYLMLLELGLSESVCRHLCDYKNEKESQQYADTIKTGTWVFRMQSAIMVIIAAIMAFPLIWLLKIPNNHATQFILLFSSQSVITALNLATRSHGAILWAHMRHDVINAIGMVTLAVNLLVFWLCLHWELGIYSIAYASLASFLLSISLGIGANRYFKHYPSKNRIGILNRDIFKNLFGFGGELFLVNIGNQLANASRVVIISRIMGLEAATIWAVATKAFSLAQTLTFRVFDSSAPALAEMQVTTLTDRVNHRFYQIFQVSILIAAMAAICISLFNQPLLILWTSGKIQWHFSNDIMLGILVVSTTAGRCLTGIATIKKRIGRLKYACLLEGIAFIGLAIPMTQYYGISGLLVSAIACNLLFSVGYGIFHVKLKAGLTNWLNSITIFKNCVAVTLVSLASWTSWKLTSGDNIQQSILLKIPWVLAMIPVIWWLVMDKPTRSELWERIRHIL